MQWCMYCLIMLIVLRCLVWCCLRVGYLLSSLGLLRFLLVGVCDGC